MTDLRFWALGALLLASLACSTPKAVVTDAAAAEPDVLERVCIREQKRFEGDEFGSVYVYRNIHMDEYFQNPWKPTEIFERMVSKDGVCREALLYLMIRRHPFWLQKRWSKVEDVLSTDNKVKFLKFIQVQDAQGFEDILFKLLSKDQPLVVRRQAAVAVSMIDQTRFARQIGRVLKSEKDPGVLNDLVMALDLLKNEALIEDVVPLFDHPDEALHFSVGVTLAQSDYEGNEALFTRDLEHENPRVRETAERVLTTLKDGGRLKSSMTINLLNARKVDPNTDSLYEKFFKAIQAREHLKAMDLIAEGVRLDQAIDKDGRNAVSAAIRAGNQLHFVRDLLRMGARVNHQDYGGSTPLMVAVVSSNIEYVEVLLKHGADPTIGNEGGITPLRMAKLSKHPEMVAMLEAAEKLKAGAE